MAVDAIIVSGGRSSRLGGTPKADLRIEGETLLDRTIAAVVDRVRTVVVAGPSGGADGRTVVVREDPPFAGPAAGVVAALAALPATRGDDDVLVLACDFVHVSAVVAELLAAPPAPSVVLSEGARPQHLAGRHRTADLRASAAALPGRGADLSVRRLLEPLHPRPWTVRAGLTADVDTWADASSAGVDPPLPGGDHDRPTP